MKMIRKWLARRRLEKTMKPHPQLRQNRLRQMSPERAERYRRNMAEIDAALGVTQDV